MTVAVLNPKDCLVKDYRFSEQPLISPVKDPRNSNPNFNNRSNRAQQPNRTKRSPPRSNRNQPPSRAAAPKVPAKNNFMMGQVKILKRGEELTQEMAAAVSKPAPTEPEKKKKSGAHPGPTGTNLPHAAVQKPQDPDLGSTDRLGPEPESVPIQIRLTEPNLPANFYAGSAFITSPPPSSLPLPAFFTKKSVVTLKNDDATTDLRRLLKLDIL